MNIILKLFKLQLEDVGIKEHVTSLPMTEFSSPRVHCRLAAMNNAEELVTKYVKLWPREVFYIKDSHCKDELKKSLNHPGVYILYQDFDVFYVGQSNCLFDRLNAHAAKRYRLWNHFSAFVVPNEQYLDYVEAIMIAATPRTANKQGGKSIGKIPLPKMIEHKLQKGREIQ